MGNDDYEDCRSAREVGERALILSYLLSAFRPKGLIEADYTELIRVAKPSLNARDVDMLFSGKDWSSELQHELFWQCEGLHVLLWSLQRHPRLAPMDQQVAAEAIISDINQIGRAPEAWLASVQLREKSELDAFETRTDRWLWRVHHARVQQSGAPPFAPEDLVREGTLLSGEVMQNDLAAFGRPFFALSPPQVSTVTQIVSQRTRAIRWIWGDFDDWWEPNLDS